jgi:hypothetical protein
VEAAAAGGVLDETHWVELKQAVPASSKPANLELARDLASLSVDGGVLIIGIADASGSAGAVTGTAVEGLESRIAQVATGRISPPLPVTIDAFPKPGNPDLGVLVVTVPASAGAPHMVDGNYWGRGAIGKRTLEDDEVRRLLRDRQARSAGFQGRLEALPDELDLGASDMRSRSRLYVLLEPAAPPEEPSSGSFRGEHPLQLVSAALSFQPQWSPSLRSLDYGVPHPNGLAASSLPPDQADAQDANYLFLLLGDDGSLRLSAPASRPYGRDPDAPEVVSPGQLLETAHSCVQLARHVATQHTGYNGLWAAGVLIDRLRGRMPSQAHSEMTMRRYSPYQAETYVKMTDTTTQEMEQAPHEVVGRLMAGLLRGLGVVDRFLPYEDPNEFGKRSR